MSSSGGVNDLALPVEYLQRGELLSSGVSPVLLSAATLQAMLRAGPAMQCRYYSQAVQLLEFIHSQSPLDSYDQEQHYIDMLVDLKIRVSIYTMTDTTSNLPVFPRFPLTNKQTL